MHQGYGVQLLDAMRMPGAPSTPGWHTVMLPSCTTEPWLALMSLSHPPCPLLTFPVAFHPPPCASALLAVDPPPPRRQTPPFPPPAPPGCGASCQTLGALRGGRQSHQDSTHHPDTPKIKSPRTKDDQLGRLAVSLPHHVGGHADIDASIALVSAGHHQLPTTDLQEVELIPHPHHIPHPHCILHPHHIPPASFPPLHLISPPRPKSSLHL